MTDTNATHAEAEDMILRHQDLTGRYMDNGLRMVERKVQMIHAGEATAEDELAVLALHDVEMMALRKVRLEIQREAAERAGEEYRS